MTTSPIHAPYLEPGPYNHISVGHWPYPSLRIIIEVAAVSAASGSYIEVEVSKSISLPSGK